MYKQSILTVSALVIMAFRRDKQCFFYLLCDASASLLSQLVTSLQTTMCWVTCGRVRWRRVVHRWNVKVRHKHQTNKNLQSERNVEWRQPPDQSRRGPDSTSSSSSIQKQSHLRNKFPKVYLLLHIHHCCILEVKDPRASSHYFTVREVSHLPA